MEAMRLQTFYLVNVHLGKKQYKSVNQLMPFAWDEETKNRIKYGTETAEMTDEDWEALDSKYPVGKLKKKEKNG